MTARRCLLLLALALASPGFCGFDDSETEAAGGGPAPMGTAEVTVELRSQEVRMDLAEETYAADCVFTFFNPGKTVTVTVGFPLYSHRMGTNLAPARFTDFKAWVDGREVRPEEVPGERNAEPPPVPGYNLRETEMRWLTTPVVFPGGREVVLRSAYKAPYTFSGDGPGCARVDFLHGTEKPWAGKVGSTTFFLKKSVPRLCLNLVSESPEPLPRWLGELLELTWGGLDPADASEALTVFVNPWPDPPNENMCDYCVRRAVPTTASLRLRREPELDAEVAGALKKGETAVVLSASGAKVEVDGKEDMWYEVVTPTGAKGWAFGGYLQVTP